MTAPDGALITWRTSSYTDTGECIEVGQFAAECLVRDSKDREGPQLAFSLRAWAAFTRQASSDSFPAQGG